MKNLGNEIVSILPQKKNKSRYTIKFKSGKIIGLSETNLISYKISVGKKISSNLLSKIDNDNVITFNDLFNPRKYGELLSMGNLQVVTWDSISMISEAISSEAGTFLFKFEEKFCPKRYLKFFDKITKLNLAKFYNQNLKPYEISIDEYNKNLKTKILNKIQSNLRFRSNNA